MWFKNPIVVLQPFIYFHIVLNRTHATNVTHTKFPVIILRGQELKFVLAAGPVIHTNLFVVSKHISLKRENFLSKPKPETWLNEPVSDIDVALSCVYV